MRKDVQYYKMLAEMYFKAETTDRQEDELKRFLITDNVCDKEFDELKAVMGYVSIGKSMRKKYDCEQPHRIGIAISAAVIITVVIGIGSMSMNDNLCYATVKGNVITDKEYVMADMRSTMADLLSDENSTDVGEELTDLFRGEGSCTATCPEQNSKSQEHPFIEPL